MQLESICIVSNIVYRTKSEVALSKLQNSFIQHKALHHRFISIPVWRWTPVFQSKVSNGSIQNGGDPAVYTSCNLLQSQLTSCTSWEFIMFWKPIIFQNFWAMSFKNHWLTSYQNIYSNISFPKAVSKTCPGGVTIFTSRHKVITSSRLLQTRLIHQGVSRLLRQSDVDQSQNVSKSADFRCEKNAFLLIGETWE